MTEVDRRNPALRWRLSSFTMESNCVEMAPIENRVVVRNSNHRDAGTLMFTRAEMAVWLDGIKAGQLDDLT